MKIAIIHHHLNTGGVTQVIRNHLLCLDNILKEKTEIALIYNGENSGWDFSFEKNLRNIQLFHCKTKALAYSNKAVINKKIISEVLKIFKKLNFTSENCIVHCHNHSLGKNASFPFLIEKLAEKGYRHLLQIHDFCEDFRPKNFQKLAAAYEDYSSVYPQAEHIHYATINQTHYKILHSAGVAKTSLHYLPNPLIQKHKATKKQILTAKETFCSIFPQAENKNILLYPVRGITRKNVGEIILLAALFSENNVFCITRAPLNPLEKPQYRFWKKIAKELKLPCIFEVGENSKISFDALCLAADEFITTSINEGFGLVFLESWLWGKNLFGRNLPEVTKDFTAAKIDLSWLYSEIKIPLDLLSNTKFSEHFSQNYFDVLKEYHVNFDAEKISHEISALFAKQNIDFAKLSKDLQKQIILKIIANKNVKTKILTLNRNLKFSASDNDSKIKTTQRLIESTFGAKKSGENLINIYQNILSSNNTKKIMPIKNTSSLLSAFLSPKRFSLLTH